MIRITSLIKNREVKKYLKNEEETMKKQTLLMLFLIFCLVGLLSADEELGVFANLQTSSIQFIDPMTNTVSGPLLKGQLGTYGSGLLDVVITSDGKTAIVSNFWDARLYFIDISGGFNAEPTILGWVWIGMLAEDMVITPDDKYVLVTDGEAPFGIAVIDIPNRKFVRTKSLGEAGVQSIAITPDGRNVIAADYWGAFIHRLTLDDEGYLKYEQTVDVLPHWPINLAISPDGKTLFVVDAFHLKSPVFSINHRGKLILEEYVRMPAREGQSCIFSSDGTKAYLQTNKFIRGRQVHILDVTGPGQVSPSGVSISLNRRGGAGGFYGVDTLALDPSENYLYVTNPSDAGAEAAIFVIDLYLNTIVDYLRTRGTPTGIAFTTIN